MKAFTCRNLVLFVFASGALGCAAHALDGEEGRARRRELSASTDSRAWAREIPGLASEALPQFVAVTFDDNFRADGITWANDFFRTLENPAGAGLPGTFDGTLARTTFFSNTNALENNDIPDAWSTSVVDGHELANHTHDHETDDTFTLEQWSDEIGTCADRLSDPASGLGLSHDDLLGFRTPYLKFNDATFQALVEHGLSYDSSVQGCRAPEENGKNCSFPYTLDAGSPDNLALRKIFSGEPEIGPHPGLWEVPLAALIVPPDDVAAQYDFPPGLRSRIPADNPSVTDRPNYYDPTSHKIGPLDITLFYDAQMTADEVRATLAYNYDLHRQGNRAPFVFVAHTHVYSSSWDGYAPQADLAARRGAIEDFVTYALSHSETRMRPLRDVVAWMRAPVSLTGQGPASGGTSSGGASAGGTAGSGDVPAEAGSGVGGGSPVSGAGGAPSEPSEGCSCRSAGAPLDAHSGTVGITALSLVALCGVVRKSAARAYRS